MVRKQAPRLDMFSTYHLKPGQTLENTKVSERKLALIASESAFQRFVDYVSRPQRLAEEREAAAAKLEAIKKATYEMSKTWDNTIENIKSRRKEELLSKSRKAEEERIQFVKEMTVKNAAERAEIVRQARKLLLYKQPQCRRINRALLASECLRELDAQVEFEKTIKETDNQREMEYVDLMKKDVEKFEQEKKTKVEEQKMKLQDYSTKLCKQIEENAKTREGQEKAELELEIQDQKNMSRDLQLIKECEAEQTLKKKKELQKLFLDTIDEKKRTELEVKRHEKFEDLAVDVYNKSKSRVKKMLKDIAKQEKQIQEQRAQFIADRFVSLEDNRKSEEEKENFKKAVNEIEEAEMERQKARKDFEHAMRITRIKDRYEAEAMKTKQKQEEKDMKTWEMLQRFKKHEYDKQIELEDRIKEENKKRIYAQTLKKHMELQKAERKREKLLNDDAEEIKAAMKQVDERVLSYGQEVLEECKGVRPLYPILKAIEECKREIGMIKPKMTEVPSPPRKPRRRRGVRRGPCTKIIMEDKTHYL
ncbi:hypothetical protein KPH14_004631 [Odynerus spinipes]|uniref:Trichohyalin-plectin-homology domain-containing protein n=1 Tax=Odynerus spinipes TaxID=1348599 RepID=A0AAD9VPK1_9HYME|nr:hypothetical protein KPH14_004631 [Odynerus spinipes]